MCLTNFNFNPSAFESVQTSFDCQFFSIPYYSVSEVIVPIRNIEQYVGSYKAGLIKSSKSSQYYTIEFNGQSQRFRSAREQWHYSILFEYTDETVQYTSMPTHLDSVVNKLTGVLGFCIFFLWYLTYINKTKFVLDLSQQLYRT